MKPFIHSRLFRKNIKAVLVVSLFLLVFDSFAQSWKLLRYDEDYSYLKDSSRSIYETIKYIPLTLNRTVYMSLGGEARVEYVSFDNEDWGAEHIGHNDFLLQRYTLHADVHFNKRVRLFSQVRSALINGRKNGPRPIDQDDLNVQNLFLDIVLLQNSVKSMTVRLGRQEIDYGSGRLVSVREGPNLRLYFTGAKLMYAFSRLSIDAFVLMADTMKPGIFDNTSSLQANLWGSYATYRIPRAGNVDLYYIGIRRDQSVFEDGIGQEIRHTTGLRFWKYGGGFIYNLEAAYQFGQFNHGRISAWTGSLDIGYVFDRVKFKPTINLRHDYISGDHKAGDRHLQTFNPLYPKGGYFGFSPQVGPVNLIDIHPYATIDFTTHFKFQADAVFNWRYSLQDGVYRPGGGFNLSGSGSAKRYIGTAWLISVLYNPVKYVTTTIGLQYFKTGGFIQDIIPDSKNGLFINTKIGFKF